MIALLMLAWLLVYHGFVLWVALRFKSKPWRWYWFAAVLIIGLGIAWIDQLYIRYVVIGHYCERDKDQLGFHEYAPARVKANQVTWLGSDKAQANVGNPPLSRRDIKYENFEQNGYIVNRSNVVSCKRSDSTVVESCLVAGYSQSRKHRAVSIWGVATWHELRHQLQRGGETVKETMAYGWGGSKFFELFPGINVSVFYDMQECGFRWNDVVDSRNVVIKVQE